MTLSLFIATALLASGLGVFGAVTGGLDRRDAVRGFLRLLFFQLALGLLGGGVALGLALAFEGPGLSSVVQTLVILGALPVLGLCAGVAVALRGWSTPLPMRPAGWWVPSLLAPVYLVALLLPSQFMRTPHGFFSQWPLLLLLAWVSSSLLLLGVSALLRRGTRTPRPGALLRWVLAVVSLIALVGAAWLARADLTRRAANRFATNPPAAAPGSERCPPLDCALECVLARDENGCPLCRCGSGKVECRQVVCKEFCEHGFALDATGCPVCECAAPP